MENSINIKLPYILPYQAQKHVTYNEAISILDSIVQLMVDYYNGDQPPDSVPEGTRCIVGENPTGAWEGHRGHLAVWSDGGWNFLMPNPGWLAYLAADARFIVFDGVGWRDAGIGQGTPQRFGVNTEPHAPNRFAVAAEATLFDHEGAGHQLKINKASAHDFASLVFQTGYSGRAEFGLAGSDDFQIKVSPDGTEFFSAVSIEAASGRVSFPVGVAGMREHLRQDRTYHVAATGSDVDDGLSETTAFATLQHAIDVAHGLDCGIHDVTIRLGAGSFAGASVLRPLFGGGLLTIEGEDAATVTVSSRLLVRGGAWVRLSGLAFAIAVDWLHAIDAGGSAHVLIGDLVFGQIGQNGDHIHAGSPAQITIEGDYRIEGGALRHIYLSGPVVLEGADRTITLAQSPQFMTFMSVEGGASVALWNLTVEGDAQGVRFSGRTNATIDLYGKPADHLPGDEPGYTESGAIYA